jgi:hypothetical protein
MRSRWRRAACRSWPSTATPERSRRCTQPAALLRPGGVLVYETFTIHQRKLGTGPRNPAFLLEPGELPRLFPQLAVVHLWEGITRGPAPNATARLLARRLA